MEKCLLLKQILVILLESLSLSFYPKLHYSINNLEENIIIEEPSEELLSRLRTIREKARSAKQ